MKKHNSLVDKNLSKTVMKALRLGWLVGRWLVCKPVDLLAIINIGIAVQRQFYSLQFSFKLCGQPIREQPDCVFRSLQDLHRKLNYFHYRLFTKSIEIGRSRR